MARYENSRNYLARARGVIPGGAQNLSKLPRCFPEGAYPAFLCHGRGATVWDVDENSYVDWIMAFGAVSLGHAHPRVSASVTRALQEGSLLSLAHPAEITLAEQLRMFIPCAEMVRFVKTGSEACSAAVRIARAATGRTVVAVGGYHGWHDWFTASRPYHPGVPEFMTQGTRSFQYNDRDSLESLLVEGNVAAVILEPTLLTPPAPGWLSWLRTRASQAGAVLVFDECRTGLRWALGGAQEYFGVVPDLACFSKALGNGVPIACVVGRRDLMEEWGQVVSGTFSGDLLGIQAALAVLQVYREENPLQELWRVGELFCREVLTLLRVYPGAGAFLEGYPVHPRIGFHLGSPELSGLALSVFLQEAALRGALFHPAGLDPSAAHAQNHYVAVERSVEACEGALRVVQEGVTSGALRDRLRGKECDIPPVRR